MSPKFGKNYKYFMQIGCYAVGFQMFTILVIISTTVGIFYIFSILNITIKPPPIDIMSDDPFILYKLVIYSLFAFLVLLVVVWPGTIFSRMILNYVPIESRRIKMKWPLWSVTIAVANLICMATIFSSAVLAYPLAKFDVSKRSKLKPLMHAAILACMLMHAYAC